MKIGIDLHGVAFSLPEFFSTLGKLFVAAGHEVHIITGSIYNDAIKEKLLKCGLIKGQSYTHYFSIATYYIEEGQHVTFDGNGNPWLDDKLWNKAKADYCKKENITIHFDDQFEYLDFFKTNYCFFKGMCGNHELSKKKIIGLLGISANPFTNAHLSMLKYVVNNGLVDCAWVLPCGEHKFKNELINLKDRYLMCEKAITGLDRISASTFDCFNDFGGSTYRLLNYLENNFPEYDFRIMLGEDNILEIDKWENSEKLLKQGKFIVFPRKNSNIKADWYKKAPHIFLKDFTYQDVSSTKVRELIETEGIGEAKLKWHLLVPEAVKKHIENNFLYV